MQIDAHEFLFQDHAELLENDAFLCGHYNGREGPFHNVAFHKLLTSIRAMKDAVRVPKLSFIISLMVSYLLDGAHVTEVPESSSFHGVGRLYDKALKYTKRFAGQNFWATGEAVGGLPPFSSCLNIAPAPVGVFFFCFHFLK